MQTTTATVASTGTQARTAPLLMALLLGTFLIGFVAMSPIDEIHNAGHDYRHSMGFPCH